MNKYLVKGLSLAITGIIAVYISYDLMEAENHWYKILMTAGVILFGYGFVLLVYRIFRKIDRNTLIDDRNKKQEEQNQEKE